MPGDLFHKVRTGETLTIPAQTWNRVIDVLRWFETRKQDIGVDPKPLVHQPGVVLVRNDSGAVRNRFDVLGVDVPLITSISNLTEFQRQVTLSGVTPTSAHAGKFVILLEPLRTGIIGWAVISGVTVGRVTVTAGTETFTRADVTPADPSVLTLKEFGGGAQVLWRESGSSGTKWATLLIGSGNAQTSGDITVEEADGSPSFSDIHTLQGDQASGIRVTQPSAGKAKLALEGVAGGAPGRGIGFGEGNLLLAARWYPSGIGVNVNPTTPGSMRTLATNTIYATPVLEKAGGTLDRLAVEFTFGGGAGANLRLGAYTNTSGTLYPDALVADFGEIDASAIATVELAISQALTANSLYWLVAAVETGGPGSTTVRVYDNFRPILGSAAAGSLLIANNLNDGFSATFTYGTLPSTFPSNFAGALKLGAPILIWRKYSSVTGP